MALASAQDMGRLRWRCRRGMRELDELLTNYLTNGFAAAGPAEQASFERLLDCPDLDLNAYCLGQRTPADPALRELIIRITTRSFGGH